MTKYVKYMPLSLFMVYGLKFLILTPTYTDGIILLVLGAVSSYYEYKNQEQKLSNLEKKIEDLSLNFKDLHKSLDDTKTHVSGIKLGQQMRSGSVR